MQHLIGDPYLCEGTAADEIVQPSDGSSVVLLAMRGECEYETKGRVATDYGSPVRYVVVYDNVDEDILIAMMANNPTGINVGMLFTSKSSGEDLKQKLENESTDQKVSGGLFVLLDSEEPYGPYIDPYGWIGGIFMLSTCCGGLLLCCQAGYIRRDGTVIIVGRPQMVQHSNLMTRQQVLDLPTATFMGGHHRRSTTAASCMDTAALKQTDEKQNADGENEPLKGEAKLASDDRTAEASSESLAKLVSNCTDGSCENANEDQIFAGMEYNTVCSICLEDFEYGEQLRVLPCRHQFHTECIIPWLTQRQGLCPLCKTQVLPEDENTEEGESEVGENSNIGGGPQLPGGGDEISEERSLTSSIASARRSARVSQWLSSNRIRLSSNNRRSNIDDGNSDEERLRSPLLLSPSEAATIGVSGV